MVQRRYGIRVPKKHTTPMAAEPQFRVGTVAGVGTSQASPPLIPAHGGPSDHRYRNLRSWPERAYASTGTSDSFLERGGRISARARRYLLTSRRYYPRLTAFLESVINHYGLPHDWRDLLERADDFRAFNLPTEEDRDMSNHVTDSKYRATLNFRSEPTGRTALLLRGLADHKSRSSRTIRLDDC